MEPRLELLIKLWSDSLEREIGQQAEAELEALLGDADLVERFAAWQAGRSATDGADPGPTPGLDQRVRAAFNAKPWVVRHWPQLLAAALGLGGLAVFINALLPRQPEVVRVWSDEQPMAAAETAEAVPRAPEATPKPTLGLPPGFGQRPTRLQAKVSGKVELGWTMPEDGLSEVRVLDSRDRLVRVVWKGFAEAGRYRNHWDGKDDQGRLVAPGSYRLQARSRDLLLHEESIEILPKP